MRLPFQIPLWMLLATLAVAPRPAWGEPGDAAASFPFPSGDELDRSQAESLEAWLPPPLWAYRDRIFYPDMRMEIGPPERDYSPAPVYLEATERNRGRARLGPEGTLEGYVSGRPFPADAIDCQNDADAGTKWIWNFVERWQGFGYEAHFLYSYWQNGVRRPLMYQGRMFAWLLKHRPEKRFEKTGGDVFAGETRALVLRFQVDRPSEISGMRGLTYRYEASFGPTASAPPEDTYVYLPAVRRVRKISENQRNGAVAGTDFTFDDLFTFSGLPAQYRWRCLRETRVLAPTNTRLLGFPYREDAEFGPSGLSFASDRWELRQAVVLEMTPRDPHHPYSKKLLWIDRQTGQPLYSFAYDRAGALWKIIYHDHRWSEDDLQGIPAREWYPAWDEVPEPRDLRVVSDAILNVQTGSGTRLEFWDSHGSMPRLRGLRDRLDARKLRRDIIDDR
ncbi:MAG: DUF1329 domain-containing protein [Myxococcota bacterium]